MQVKQSTGGRRVSEEMSERTSCFLEKSLYTMSGRCPLMLRSKLVRGGRELPTLNLQGAALKVNNHPLGFIHSQKLLTPPVPHDLTLPLLIRLTRQHRSRLSTPQVTCVRCVVRAGGLWRDLVVRQRLDVPPPGLDGRSRGGKKKASPRGCFSWGKIKK